MGWFVLKTPLGKFLQIQTFKSTLTLCVEEGQNEDEKVPQVCVNTTNDNREAYKFRYEECWYWVKAVKSDVWKLVFVKEGSADYAPFWFEKEDLHASGEYGLRFTDDSTNFYLATKSDDGVEVLTITDNRDDCLIVTHEERNEP